MKIESLAGLGVVKVECGSQFSVALTRSGSVYTWCVAINIERNNVTFINNRFISGVREIITDWVMVMEIM